MTKTLDQELIAKRWSENNNTIWMGSFLKLFRNLKTHHFPHKLDEAFLSDLTQMLKHPLQKTDPFKRGLFYLMKDLSFEHKQLLFEHFMFRHNYPSFHAHEALLIDSKFRFQALINTSDHLIFDYVDQTNHLEEAWNKLIHIENDLSKEIEFAFSPKLGFLTSQINHCGTGLRIDLLLHLPALISQDLIQETYDTNSHFPHSYSSIDGSKEEFLGNLVLISNQQTFGISEEQLLKSMHSVALNLILAEKRTRESVCQKSSEIKNEVSKAFGTLKHAYQLELKEAMEALSLCKLGLELGWIHDLAPEQINTLLLSVGKGHLKFTHQKEDIEANAKRALWIQKELREARL